MKYELKRAGYDTQKLPLWRTLNVVRCYLDRKPTYLSSRELKRVTHVRLQVFGFGSSGGEG
jgi:hypothetical protein